MSVIQMTCEPVIPSAVGDGSTWGPEMAEDLSYILALVQSTESTQEVEAAKLS